MVALTAADAQRVGSWLNGTYALTRHLREFSRRNGKADGAAFSGCEKGPFKPASFSSGEKPPFPFARGITQHSATSPPGTRPVSAPPPLPSTGCQHEVTFETAEMRVFESGIAETISERVQRGSFEVAVRGFHGVVASTSRQNRAFTLGPMPSCKTRFPPIPSLDDAEVESASTGVQPSRQDIRPALIAICC